jgi:epoxyqueuosine reductase
VVDARRCLSYQSIENRGAVPASLRRGFRGRMFGCDVCQEVCPWNRADFAAGDARFEPRPLAQLGPAEVAALSPQEFQRLSAGMALARAQYDGLRRNALSAIGAARDRGARALVARLARDESPVVRDAARWAKERLS